MFIGKKGNSKCVFKITTIGAPYKGMHALYVTWVLGRLHTQPESGIARMRPFYSDEFFQCATSALSVVSGQDELMARRWAVSEPLRTGQDGQMRA